MNAAPSARSSNTPLLLSLFSGAGGLDLGFRRAGFDIALSVDLAPAAIATLRRNFGEASAIMCDLRRLPISRLVDALKRRAYGASSRGIIGGPPCQGLSQGNAKRNAKDPRNKLLFTYASIIQRLDEAIGIDYFVFENVVGLRDAGETFPRLERAFTAAGYRLYTHELNAYDFGVPQVRRRIFVVGLHATRMHDRHFVFPRRGGASRNIRDVLQDLPEPAFFSRGIDSNKIPFHPNHWTMVPKSRRFQTGRFNRWRSFRRLRWDEPSPTVAYGNREIHVHPDGRRRLTILEAMRLQGFPPSYVLEGNFSDQVTQVSNAVPPPLAFAIARSLRRTLAV